MVKMTAGSVSSSNRAMRADGSCPLRTTTTRPAFSAASMAIKIRRSCGIKIATRSPTRPPELNNTLGKAVGRLRSDPHR